MSTREVFDKISVWYDNVELNKVPVLKNYAYFLCSVFDSGEQHTAAMALHTGAEYYQAIAVAISALGCLFYHNTDTCELIDSLSEGDLLIVDGQRVQFLGIIDGKEIGLPKEKYFCVRFNDQGGKKYIPFETALQLNISLYQGKAGALGRKGVKSTSKQRKDFLSAFAKTGNKGEVSAEIDHSVALVIDRDKVEKMYREIYFVYGSKKVRLSDLVTAAYYSDEESYQIGNNPTKEDSLLKFFSKVSTCRSAIIDDKQKRIIGCIIGDENLWLSNSEISDIVDRKGLNFAILLGKTHYTHYFNWHKGKGYLIYAITPEMVKKDQNDEAFIPKVMKKEILAFRQRKVSASKIGSEIDSSIYIEIKKRLLQIKKDFVENEEKEKFLINSYSLLNLCRSSFYPLIYCDKAYRRKLLGWDLSEKIKTVKQFGDSLIGEIKECAKFVATQIEQMVLSLYDFNPKGELIKRELEGGREIYIVSTKLYHEKLFSLWLEDCEVSNHPHFIASTAFEKNGSVLENVVFPTVYYDSSFNPYASFAYVTGEILMYNYEERQSYFLERNARIGSLRLYENNDSDKHMSASNYNLDIQAGGTEIDTFEEEMEDMMTASQLRDAYSYISSTEGTRDAVTKIERIITFASGNVGYFTKYYKGYRLRGDVVVDADLMDFNVGDNMVFTKQNENKDIVNLLLVQLINDKFQHTKYPEYLRLANGWKQALRDYMYSKNLSYQQIADRLKKLGCAKHQVTVRAWLNEEFHIVGPRNVDDYKAIVELTKLSETPEEVWKGCEEIRRLRMKILDRLGKAIIRSFFWDEKDPIMELVSQKFENLAQIEQITGITSPGANINVPIYMTNKPVCF